MSAPEQTELFATDAQPKKTTRRHAMTDAGLAHFQAAYPHDTLSKEDLFYYIYGLLHSEDYKAKYAVSGHFSPSLTSANKSERKGVSANNRFQRLGVRS